MDKIHDCDNKPWISTRKIVLEELINQRIDELTKNNVLPGNSENSQHSHLLNQLNNFVEQSEKDVKPYFLFNSTDEKSLVTNPDCKLKTYELQLEHAKKMISDRAYKVEYLLRLRTTRKELLMRHLASTNRQQIANVDITRMSDDPPVIALVVVQIWTQPNKGSKTIMEKEIIFRADQCLTDLRDQFKCQRDYGVPMDLSDDPDQAERIFRGELFKSGYFLIDDTFYNDMRDPNNKDLSLSVIEWATKEVTTLNNDGDNLKTSRGIEATTSEKMEDKKFKDLKFRLGCPYLYLHQGDCEHLFTISDIRYVPNDLKLKQTKFPFVTATSIGRKADNLRCYMCKSRPPHWYTRNNNRLPLDPFFFCEECFNSFNYDKDRKKIGQFQAYLYTSSFGIPDSVIISDINRQT